MRDILFLALIEIGSLDLKITKILDNKKEIIVKKIYKRKYNIQKIDGLPENKVTPPESVYKRIKEENNKIGEARAINSDLNFLRIIL
jgi:hypothetical protein